MTKKCKMVQRLYLFKWLYQMSFWRFISSPLLIITTNVVAPVNPQFDVVAKKRFFMDRSLLLDRLFIQINPNAPFSSHPIILIGPRKSGKTTNLSMISQFFELCVDERGKVQAPNTTKHYTLFKNLEIGQRPSFKSHFARSPVIQLNLAEFVVGTSEHDFRASFCKVAHTLIKKHQFLEHIKAMKAFLDPKTCKQQSVHDLTRFGKTLAQLLRDHFHSNVLVLIDNVDAPAMSIIESNSSLTNEEPIKNLFSFVRMLIDGYCVWGSFLTGATRQGVFLGDEAKNNVHAIDQRVREFYGVTDTQLRKLLTIAGLSPTKKLMTNLLEMYGRFGNVPLGQTSHETVYNTQSVIRFCEEKAIKPHWEVAQGILPFKKLLSPQMLGPRVENAMYRVLITDTKDDLAPEGLFGTRDFLNGKTRQLPHNAWDIVGYLWESGVLTQCPKQHLGRGWCVTVPNNENRLILLDAVFDTQYYMTKHGVNKKHVYNFVASVAHLEASETSIGRLAGCVSRLFVKGATKLCDEAVFRYPLYNYLRQDNEDFFSKVIAEGRKTQRKSDIIVTLKDGTNIFLALTLNQESGQDALKQVLEDEQLQVFSKVPGSKFVCLGVNLMRSNSRCDVSYLNGSTNLEGAKNVTRLYQNMWTKISNRAKSWFH